MAATWAIWTCESTSTATLRMARRRPRRRPRCPSSATSGWRRRPRCAGPSRTIDRASTVAVVVPSPATSSVFLATSLTSSAPIFSYGSSSSISLAMETPSFVMVGRPTSSPARRCGPWGRGGTTASASWFMFSRRLRAAPRRGSVPAARGIVGCAGGGARRPIGPAAGPKGPGDHARVSGSAAGDGGMIEGLAVGDGVARPSMKRTSSSATKTLTKRRRLPSSSKSLSLLKPGGPRRGR